MPTPKEPFNGHTPLPWELGGLVSEPVATLEDQYNLYPPPDHAGPIAEISGRLDAEFVHHAVNTYYDREELIAELVNAVMAGIQNTKLLMEHAKGCYLEDGAAIEGMQDTLAKAHSLTKKNG